MFYILLIYQIAFTSMYTTSTTALISENILTLGNYFTIFHKKVPQLFLHFLLPLFSHIKSKLLFP